ncbi:hypothetical protein ABK040_006699 [Willaertia magna]
MNVIDLTRSHTFYQFENITTTSNNTLQSTTSCIPFDEEGFPKVQWIYSVFGECIHSPLEQASFYIGLLSIVLWVCALFPQVVKNFKNRDASSMSIGLLAQWIVGDSSNLIGAILTGQLVTQIILACYFLSMSVTLTLQYVVFGYLNRKKNEEKKNIESEEDNVTTDDTSSVDSAVFKDLSKTTTVKVTTVGVLLLLIIFVCLQYSSSSESLSVTNVVSHSRKLLSFNLLDDSNPINTDNEKPKGNHLNVSFPPKTTKAITGYIIGSICSILYIGSRFPQIYKNFKRKSVEGLSIFLFLFAFSGGFTYALSIFLFSTDSTFLLSKLPWILSACCNCTSDVIIMGQFIFFNKIYKKKDKLGEIVNTNDLNKNEIELTKVTQINGAKYGEVEEEEI